LRTPPGPNALFCLSTRHDHPMRTLVDPSLAFRVSAQNSNDHPGSHIRGRAFDEGTELGKPLAGRGEPSFDLPRRYASRVSEQRLLPFSAPLPNVPGLAYVDGYVSGDEERELLTAIDGERWLTDYKRRRQVYGVAYSGPQAGTKLNALPTWLSWLVTRVRQDGWLRDEVVNAVINEYLPGQGISAHFDHPAFGPTVVAVSLGAATSLELENPSAPQLSKVTLDVQPRSLWVLGGQARSHWQHGIAARQSDLVNGLKRPRERRVSVTLRTLARAS
jgi:alkylated DNA repair dioxygenase AlkB